MIYSYCGSENESCSGGDDFSNDEEGYSRR